MGPYDTEGMPDDAAAPSQPDSDMGDEKPGAPTDDEAGPQGVTALLPKSICPGMDLKPGAEFTVKVVKSYEDELEVEYVKGDQSDTGDDTGGDMANSESQLDSLSEPAQQ